MVSRQRYVSGRGLGLQDLRLEEGWPGAMRCALLLPTQVARRNQRTSREKALRRGFSSFGMTNLLSSFVLSTSTIFVDHQLLTQYQQFFLHMHRNGNEHEVC